MKRIVCEMCNGSDFVKQEGMYVCNHCGTKYTLEEAKKLMVEGTVKIDNSDKLQNLYIAARQARNAGDSANAERYYRLIMQEEPTSWEATFYNVYYKAMQTKIGLIESSAKSIENSLTTVFNMLFLYESNENTRLSAGVEIARKILDIAVMFEANARSSFRSLTDDHSSGFMTYWKDYCKRSTAVYTLLLTTGVKIDGLYESPIMKKAAVALWKAGAQYAVDVNIGYDAYKENLGILDSGFGDRIRKYEPDYVLPNVNLEGFPGFYIRVLRKQNRTPSSGGSSSGCYVATAVYGSYDCPQVWTLRRFRDNTLGKTWYGRAFISTYYAISPTLVKWFGSSDWFKKLWKHPLDSMVKHLNADGVENTPYQDKNW